LPLIGKKSNQEALMGILTWVVMGLIVGVVAKFIMPGTGPGGIIFTVVLGIAGALIGGFIGTSLGLGTVTGFNLISFLLALAGAVIVLILFRVLRRSKP
jgi:uncharacterized membrane protein YeaQ/YmgE (transglycosylase-associated protein family)